MFGLLRRICLGRSENFKLLQSRELRKRWFGWNWLHLFFLEESV